ncbi:MAG: hypothetical protein AB7P76_05190 [Candidatus Melainabacteria bacterium]
MSTLLTLVNAVLRRTGQQTITTVVNARNPARQTVDFLNDIYTEMLQRLAANRLQKNATLTTSIGVTAYTLATDADVNLLVTDSVAESGSATVLKTVDSNHPLLQGETATGLPEAYYIQGDQIHLYPAPDAVYTIQYAYYLKPTALSGDSDAVELPAEWEHVLILGTQARLEKFLGEPASETTYLMYRDGMAQLKKMGLHKPHTRMKGNYRGSR